MAVALVATTLSGAAGSAQAVEGFAEVQQAFLSSDAGMFDRHGELIQQLRLNPNERRLSWIPLEDVSPRGTSTITMQLAGLIYEDLRRKSSVRSVKQKVSQVFIPIAGAQLAQGSDSGGYLNLVSFRGELVGVHALRASCSASIRAASIRAKLQFLWH